MFALTHAHTLANNLFENLQIFFLINGWFFLSFYFLNNLMLIRFNLFPVFFFFSFKVESAIKDTSRRLLLQFQKPSRKSEQN